MLTLLCETSYSCCNTIFKGTVAYSVTLTFLFCTLIALLGVTHKLNILIAVSMTLLKLTKQ